MTLHIGADNRENRRKIKELRIQHERLGEERFLGGIDGIRLQPQIDMVAGGPDKLTFPTFRLMHHPLLRNHLEAGRLVG